LLSSLTIALALSACGEEHDHSDHDHDHGDQNHDMGDATGMCSGESTLTAGDLTFTLVSDPSMMPLNSLFSLTVTVSDENGDSVEGALTFDATMPDHGHGMNVEPTVSSSAAGEYLIEGINLHMPGTWKLDFSLDVDGTVTDATVDYECAEG
jgi:hypothetical protein